MFFISVFLERSGEETANKFSLDILRDYVNFSKLSASRKKLELPSSRWEEPRKQQLMSFVILDWDLHPATKICKLHYCNN